MIKLVILIILVLLLLGCRHSYEINNNPPNVPGYTAIDFRQPIEGELIWGGGTSVHVFKGDFKGNSWILIKNN